MKNMNHTEYQKKVKKMGYDQLLFVIKDCKEAIQAMPDGENVGYYADEIHYCTMELNRRANKKARKADLPEYNGRYCNCEDYPCCGHN